MPERFYKTCEQIEAEAKRGNKVYVGCNYDFDDGRERFITAERREELFAIQQKLFNVDFDVFLDAIYAMPLPDEIIKMFEDTYYNKPLYALAVLGSGGVINLNKVLSDLKSVQGNSQKQKGIAEELSAQICVAAMKGIVRDNYSMLISLQNGYEGKASRAFMGNFRNFYQYAAIYTGVDFSNEVYVALLDLIEVLKADRKAIRSYGYDKIAEEVWCALTEHSFKEMVAYTNKYLSKLK